MTSTLRKQNRTIALIDINELNELTNIVPTPPPPPTLARGDLAIFQNCWGGGVLKAVGDLK